MGPALIATTFTVIVFGVASRSTPPLAVPASSWTWKMKLAYAAPLAFADGVKTRLPAAMLAAETDWPAVTATPESVRLPAAGKVAIVTLESDVPVSSASVNPKSAVLKT
jgi:hypothetical protein